MEKRLLLAFALSFLVLTLWSGLNRTPRTLSDHIENKYVASDQISSSEIPSIVTPESNKIDQAEINETLSSLGNNRLGLQFSNKGGVLNKVTIKNLDVDLPLIQIAGLSQFQSKDFRLDRLDNYEIRYSLNTNGLSVNKSYKLNTDEYIVHSEISIKNNTKTPINFSSKSTAFIIDFKEAYNNKEEWAKKHGHDQSLYEYVTYSRSGISRKSNAYKFTSKEDKLLSEPIDWIGFRTRYTCALVKPDFSTENLQILKTDDHILNLEFQNKELTINPNEKIELNYVMYFGPEDTKILKTYGFEFEKIKRFYRWSLFDGVAKIIYWLLHSIFKIIGSWGASIILIAIIIYLATYPLTIKSMASMKKMQDLNPKVAVLKEKYKDNPQRMNKEMMDLYKENKINPLAGCLPVLLQMPVFIGLYQVLWRDPSFKGATFLWIKDLSLPDKLISDLPVIGLDLNVFPLLMCVIMFFQQRLTTKNMVYADPDQAAQQKMIANIMPIMMAVIFYNFASGINLYFTVFYLFSAITQLKMSKVKNV